MSYLDIAFIALIVIFALIGVKRGFIKSVIGMFGWIVSLLIAFFCAKPLAEWLAGGVCKNERNTLSDGSRRNHKLA